MSLPAGLAEQGFSFVEGARMAASLGALPDWDRFAASWSAMPLDTQLPEGHRYRRRRYATLSALKGEDTFRIEPHQPHYQAREYNQLVGGIERWFDPIPERILATATFGRVMSYCLALFGSMRPDVDWHVEVHQFRIEARRDVAGQPTPEGVHRDGVDYVLVLLVSRVNIESGTTTVHDMSGNELGKFTLATPLDSALVDDNRVKHGVTAVRAIRADEPAHRDVLVITFRAKPSQDQRLSQA